MRSVFRSMFVVSVALLAFGGVSVASASATAGPEWFVKGESLPAGKVKATTSVNLKGIQINQTPANFECEKEGGTGEIAGGVPGTGSATIVLKECTLDSEPGCQLSSSSGGKRVLGQVTLAVKTVLVFPVGGTGEALEALVPAGGAGANVFATLSIEGRECGLLNGKLAVFKATGTEIKEPAFNSRCGMLARVGQVKSGAFATLASEAQTTEGALNFPASRITGGELWQPASGTFKEITCESQFLESRTTVAGTLKQELSPSELFGWKV